MTLISPIAPLTLDTENTVSAAVPAGVATAKSFGSYMADAASNAVSTLRAGETAMIDGLTGKASAQDVVNAVIAAESTLTTVVSIRDKAIAAYNDILRMPV